MEITAFWKLFITLIFINLVGVESFITMSLDRDLACASGISSIPPLDRLKLPMDTFPSIIPSGVSICDASCGQTSKCTYNWADSLSGGFPFLLFRCQCPSQCPPPKFQYSGYLRISCEDVTNSKSRCICPYGKSTFKCIISVLPFQQKNPYYCVCCQNTVF